MLYQTKFHLNISELRTMVMVSIHTIMSTTLKSSYVISPIIK